MVSVFQSSSTQCAQPFASTMRTDENWLQASLPVKDGGLGIRSAATLALSAFLASAASTSELQANLPPPESADTSDELVNTALEAWISQTGSEPPAGAAAHRQRAWDSC